MNGSEERTGRETRLLLLVVFVAVAVLLVLARFRFPETPLTTVAPAPGPLERLAVRSSYDDLGRAIALIVDRVGRSVVVLRLEPELPPSGGRGGDVARPSSAPGDPSEAGAPASTPLRLAAAVRVRPDLALLHLPSGWRVLGDAPVAIDPARSIALVRVPAERGAGGVPDALDGFAGFRYVAAVEPAIGGPTARPVFVGRLDATSDPAWPASPFVLGGDVNVEPGTLLFALDGRFVGIVAATPSGRALVPPATLDLVVRQMTAAGAPQEADDAPGR
jgi:hypothetical protein